MSKFSKGDRVRILCPMPGHRAGDVGIVSDSDSPVTVEVPGVGSDLYWDEELALEPIALDAFQIPSPGMTSVVLAQYTARTAEAVSSRIRGTGNEQYATSAGQQFEGMTPDALLQYAREEAQDLIAYGVMLDIRLARVQEALNGMALGETNVGGL
ncbi:hypothetical protein ACQPZJ_35615 [Actinoplanes sp. CA-054009]